MTRTDADTSPAAAPAAEPLGWERYRLIADNSSDVVYQTSTDGLIRWVQPTVEALLGYRPEELIGVSARSLVHPDDLTMVNRLRLQVYDGAELDEIPCRFLTSQGTFVSCAVRARPLRAEGGAVIGAVMTLRDVHEKAAALKAVATLLAANTELVRADDESALMHAMCSTIVETGGYRLAAYVRKVHDERRSVELVAAAGPGADILGHLPTWDDAPEGQGPTATALRTGTTQVVDDIPESPRTTPWSDAARHFHLTSAIAVPVTLHGEVDGAIAVATDESGVFDDLARELLENLAADLGYGIERIRERRRLDRAMARNQEQRQRLRGILDAQLDPLVLLEAVRDESGRIVDLRYVEANEAVVAYYRRPRRELIGQSFLELHPLLRTNGLAARYMDVVATGRPVILDDYSYGNPRLDGAPERRYDIRAVKSGDAVALTWRDVTTRFEEQERLAASEIRYRTLVENMSDVVWETAEDGTVAWVSESIHRALGWRPDQLIGTPTVDLIHPDDRDRAARNRDLVLTGISVHQEFRVLTAAGGYRWMALSAHLAGRPRGKPVRIVALRDIDEVVQERARLDHATRHDPVTGLVTRASVVARLQALLDEGAGIVAVLRIGIDGLSRVNAALTHDAGDELLSAVAARLLDEVGDADHVGRGAGDEFIVLLPRLREAEEAGAWADRLRAAIRRPMTVAGHGLTPTATIGVATSDTSTSGDAEHVMHAASVAMRDAKRLGGDRTMFVDPALAEAARARLSVEQEIAAAVEGGELQPWLQPVVDFATRETVGYEALVRWVRPDGSIRPPDEFLPVAERSSLILAIDVSVVSQAVALLRSIPAPRHIAVNVSAASVIGDEYADSVLALLQEHSVDPGRLILEITETTLFQDLDLVRGTMQRLADVGLRWYVDDFGTGYSSIAHLRDLPVAGLKLDRSFTHGIGEGDPTCIRLAQALAGLASGLELDTVAEGVETEDEAAHLAAQGWRHGQGWLYGKAEPLPGVVA